MNKRQAIVQNKVKSIHKCVDGVIFEIFNNSDTVLIFWGSGEKDRIKAKVNFNHDSLWEFGKIYLSSIPC